MKQIIPEIKESIITSSFLLRSNVEDAMASNEKKLNVVVNSSEGISVK